MKARMVHENIHVLDLEKSLAFYRDGLGLSEFRRVEPDDGSWCIVFIGNSASAFELELTWNRGRTEPYNNGGEDTHLAFEVEDIDEAHKLHAAMDCIAYENRDMGIYFITDPDGCWLEILPQRETSGGV
ncbi:MAG: VOC family protein [Coriobacteriales bacterium]|jgi:lactoylglutathione lyase|nr:VOC family protein [Coriobacteriales bacterium]